MRVSSKQRSRLIKTNNKLKHFISFKCTLRKTKRMSSKIERTLLDSDKEEDQIMAPCFQINYNIEFKEIPTNGEEYLLQVMNERRKYVAVTKCNTDISKFAKNQSRFAEELPSTPVAPEGLKPTIEWQNIQVADFSEIRLYVSRMYLNKEKWPKTVKKIVIDPHDLVLWKRFFDTHMPTLSCLFGLKQSYIDYGLSVLVKFYLSRVKPGQKINDVTGKWMYAFLAYLPLPLLPDTISLLRDLARKCAELRSHIKVEENQEEATLTAAPFNLFICLVSRYFRQWDLADK